MILATLAMSTSSSVLAAPAADARGAGLADSESNHHIASRSGAVAARGFRSEKEADDHRRRSDGMF